ncbi:MAG: putative photosynthetic complex assembly protein PuhE [Gemmobacter sp.]
MLTSPALATLAALFLWWFSTGAILWRVKAADAAQAAGRGTDGHVWSVVLALPLLILGLFGFVRSLHDPSAGGVYTAFLAALAIWAWIEVAFLSGVITGPNTEPCPPFAGMGERFVRAVGTIAWHEILLALTLVWMLAQTPEAANPFATWTFAVLFLARVSAKLNLFLGVPRIHTEFLPRPLAHLPSHFRHARMNGLFPASVTLLTLATGCWIERAMTAPTEAATLGFTLLAALTALALLEHWFMVLPVPDEKLWRWMMPAPKPEQDRLRKDA